MESSSPSAPASPACGASKGDGSTPTVLTGRFIDSAVSNLGYRTATQQGRTGAGGEFTYLAGEQVTFSVGPLAFPAVPAQPVVTPLSYAPGATNLTDRRIVNVTRLLVSLDANGTPGDGIAIPQFVTSVAAATIDLDVPVAVFEASSAVTTLVHDAVGGTGALAPADVALQHLRQSTVVGTYVRHAQGDPTVLVVLFADGTYVEAEPLGDAPNGMEAGTYAWDPVAQRISFTRTFETNGSGGFGQGVGTTSAAPAHLDASGALVLTNPQGQDVTFDAVPVGTSIHGTWRDAGGSLGLVVVLLETGEFMVMEAEGEPTNGLEYGTFTWDPSGAGTFHVTFDDNTNGGLNDPPGIDTFPATVTGVMAWDPASADSLVIAQDRAHLAAGDKITLRRW